MRSQAHGLSPENMTSAGGNIAIRTRSGTNQWHGSVFAANRPEAASAADWFANAYSAYSIPRNTSRMEEEGAAAGGPLQRDRTFFFFSAERLDLRQAYTWATTVPSLTARLLAPTSLLPFLDAFPVPNGPGTASFGISELVGSSLRPASLTAGMCVSIVRSCLDSGLFCAWRTPLRGVRAASLRCRSPNTGTGLLSLA